MIVLQDYLDKIEQLKKDLNILQIQSDIDLMKNPGDNRTPAKKILLKRIALREGQKNDSKN